jgi:hypothetical protein
MLNCVLQTDYDAEMIFAPSEWYHEPVLAVTITDEATGAMAETNITIENAEHLRDYLNEWLPKAAKALEDGTEIDADIDTSDIPF